MTGGSTAPNRWPWRWHVAQAGAREHYAVPRAVRLTSDLAGLYTSAWCRHGVNILKKGPLFLRSFAGHQHSDIPSGKVVSFNLGAVGWSMHRSLWARPRSVEQVYRWEVDNSRWFAERVWARMKSRPIDPNDECFFGFQSECLETMTRLRERGVVCVLDMAGPGRVEDDLVQQEAQRWSGWATIEPRVPDFYYDRIRGEWCAASIVLVNSEWSRRAWIQQGVPEEKIVVVPLAYEPGGSPPVRRERVGGPLTVLWLGSVILRKGIQYLIEAARLLSDMDVRIIVAGPVGISAKAVASSPSNMEFTGRIARGQAVDLYRNAHVFVLPTISDGFAITQLEAMAQSVPVIATPNCGQVVTHGVDGLIVPAADSRALAQAIARLDGDRSLLASMSEQALVKCRQFSVRRYGERLNFAVSALRQGKSLQ